LNDLAEQKIAELVKEFESYVTISCVIPKKYHRTVMGQRGANVQNITADYGVNIKFPEREIPGTGKNP